MNGELDKAQSLPILIWVFLYSACARVQMRPEGWQEKQKLKYRHVQCLDVVLSLRSVTCSVILFELSHALWVFVKLAQNLALG
jgi:hypothetical protein